MSEEKTKQVVLKPVAKNIVLWHKTHCHVFSSKTFISRCCLIDLGCDWLPRRHRAWEKKYGPTFPGGKVAAELTTLTE